MASILDQDSTPINVSHFHHTPSYCEENVYLLCKKLSEDGVADVCDLFVVFISNESKHIPMWHQKASHRSDGIVLWDYHVICIQRRKEGRSEDLVWDLDSTLPFPSTLSSYVSESIRPSFELFSEFQRVFRVVHAPVFLRHFASDRRHMKDSEGNWTSPPPEHKVIVAEDGTVHNLNQYMDMSTKDVLKDIEKDSIGGVFTEQLGVLVGENQLEHFFSCISRNSLTWRDLNKNPHDNHSSSLSLWLLSKVLPSYEVDVSGVHPYLFESAGALQFPHSDCAYTFEKIRTLPAIRTFHSDSFRSLLSILMFDDNRTSLCFLSSGSEIHASMLGFKGNNTGINLIIP